ncbi:uncharacterized protein LOC102451216 isoform X3 [Pelodiscus sinensis]|uniref:uncharacterized protein LOC102451216 isoform X3 n=1 Tax=Pelodiscus sinensis TaxID=13735 RepID=UPI003F6B80F2
MAFRTSVRLQLLSLLLGLSSMNNAGAGAQEFQLLQPQGAVSVSAGETLTLPCSVTGNPPTGPTKWFKGSGPTRQLVYEDKDSAKGSFPRVTRVANTDSDFTIRISDTRPEDAGTYRCVKFKKGLKGDEEIGSGAGTAVSVSNSAQSSSVAVAATAGTVCVLLVVLLLISVYFFVRKKRGTSSSPDRSQTPLPDKTRTQTQPREEKGSDVLYADLQHSARPQKPKQSAPEEHSEYAAIKVTQSTAR